MNSRTVARFWSKVDRRGPTPQHLPHLGPCWIWTASKAGKGYGSLCVTRTPGRKRQEYAHRFSFELHYTDPGTKMVLHRCDNPSCVRPEHLFLGDAAINAKDRISKGRESHPNPARGENQHLAKMTEESVRAARTLRQRNPRMATHEIAALFGVSPSTMFAVLKRETWRHVA